MKFYGTLCTKHFHLFAWPVCYWHFSWMKARQTLEVKKKKVPYCWVWQKCVFGHQLNEMCHKRSTSSIRNICQERSFPVLVLGNLNAKWFLSTKVLNLERKQTGGYISTLMGILIAVDISPNAGWCPELSFVALRSEQVNLEWRCCEHICLVSAAGIHAYGLYSSVSLLSRGCIVRSETQWMSVELASSASMEASLVYSLNGKLWMCFMHGSSTVRSRWDLECALDDLHTV